MDEQYTPSTEDILRGFSAPRYKIDPQREDEDFAAYLSRMSIDTLHSGMASEAAARRWLTAHDREVAEKAWDEAITYAAQFVSENADTVRVFAQSGRNPVELMGWLMQQFHAPNPYRQTEG